MQMIPVQSSNIKAIGHDPTGYAFVEFKNGGRYRYGSAKRPVSAQIFEAILKAPSKGKAVDQLLKKAGFPVMTAPHF